MACGAITATMHTTSSGQGHETLVGTVVGEVLERRSRYACASTRPDSLNSLPSGTPVGSRMAIMLGGAAFHAANKLKTKLMAIAAHDLGIPLGARGLRAAATSTTADAPRTSARGPISSQIAHRNYPPHAGGHRAGAARSTHVYQVPTGGTLPTSGRARADVSLLLVRVAFAAARASIRISAGREIVRYRLGHDCGTQINPKIVRGMTMGGIAHGIGAALYEEFAYNDDGQLIAQTFMDYLLPSSHEVPGRRHRRSRDAVASYRARSEGLGRVRLSRRAGGDRQRHQRRAAPARYLDQYAAD